MPIPYTKKVNLTRNQGVWHGKQVAKNFKTTMKQKLQSKRSTKQQGILGEQLVAAKLELSGFTILAQNYTKQYGEIDIIAQKDERVLFVEVKTRHNPLFVMAELIPRSKQKKMIAVAKEYIARHNIVDVVCQSDVALVTLRAGKNATVTYIPNAFTEDM